MPKLRARALLLLALLCPVDAAIAEPASVAHACPGIAISSFEGRIPDQVQRYEFDHAKLEPFVQLWHAARRPDLPVRPERVTVYAVPGRPFLVGYESGGCMIAFLAVERQRLLQWLRPRLGWSI
jgi:hypothetical protein